MTWEITLAAVRKTDWRHRVAAPPLSAAPTSPLHEVHLVEVSLGGTACRRVNFQQV